jgi:hypothetical protein
LERYVREREFREHDGKHSPSSFLSLPLRFDDPERLHTEIVGSFDHVEGDWYADHPHYRALAVYEPSSPEDEEVWIEANPSETEEFFVVDSSDPDCPVLLWTHDTPFTNMDRIADNLDDFLDALTASP